MLPRISIIIPTHNGALRLRRTLAALAAQTVTSDTFELIIVGDGCTDHTASTVAETSLPCEVTYLEQPALGAGTARNRGAAVAKAPLLLFLDDDVEPAPDLVRAHLAAHDRRPGGIVLGYFPIPVDDTGADPFAVSVRQLWDDAFRERSRPDYRFSCMDFCTGNLSLPTEAFRRVGGFYEKIGACGGEDWELGVRLMALGLRFQYVPEALGLHHRETSWAQRLRRRRDEGKAHALMVQRHPEFFCSFDLHRLSRLGRFPLVWRALWRSPWPAEFAARLLTWVMPWLIKIDIAWLMWPTYRALAGYHYWRGVMEGCTSLRVFEEMERAATRSPPNVREIELDIASDMSSLDDRLEQEHADAVQVFCKGEPVGIIPARPGAERLAGVHVKTELVSRFEGVLLGLLADASRRVSAAEAGPLAKADAQDTTKT